MLSIEIIKENSALITLILIRVLIICFIYWWYRKCINGRRYTRNTRIDDKVCIITGANSGLGYETAIELAKRGGRIYLACRDLDAAEQTRQKIVEITKNTNIYICRLDLSSFRSIRAFVQEFISHENHLDYLINTAGVLGVSASSDKNNTKPLTEDDVEYHMAVNYIGPFLLIFYLLDYLKKPLVSRVINTIGIGFNWLPLNVTNLNCERRYNSYEAYLQSKHALWVFSMELAKRLKSTGISIYCLSPGLVNTNLLTKSSSNWLCRYSLKLIQWLFFKTPASGAQTILYATLDSNLQRSTGYYFKCKLLVLGGGTGGCTMASKLSSTFGSDGNIVVLEPNDKHYYQPMFTMIGGGMKKLSESYIPMKSAIPKTAKWIKDEASNIDPIKNLVTTKNGDNISYELLIIAVGLQLKYDKIPGLTEALSSSTGNVTTIYSPKYVERHLECLKKFNGNGNIIFTFPASPVKCPGAPQKICYITEEYLRINKKRDKANIIYNTALPVIFGVKYFADALWKVVKKRNITVNLQTNLIEIKPNDNLAIFEKLDKKEKFEIKYSILHVTPPQGPPSVLLKDSNKIAQLTNEAGFVSVDKYTLQHEKYSNIFAIGDCSSTPNSKTMAAIASQSDVVYKNVLAHLNGKPLLAKYDGYASCPLVTGYTQCIMAEFDYDLNPKETFPFAQNQERYSMFLMKKYGMPVIYWKLMLNGLWSGPETIRKLFSIFKFN